MNHRKINMMLITLNEIDQADDLVVYEKLILANYLGKLRR